MTLVAAAACTGGSHPAGTRSTAAGPAAEPRATPQRPVAVTGAPACSTATAAAPALHRVPVTLGPVPGAPFGVAATADGRWAFVSFPGAGSVDVFRIGRQAVPAQVRQLVPAGQPLGETLTRSGRYLLAADDGSGAGVISVSRAERGQQGTLTVINLDRAETDPGASVAVTVTAGCSPVRVATSADGRVVWVTARGSDRLLAFSAARLRTDPAHALIASVEVGEAPVGLALVDRGQRIVAADSNRFGTAGAASSLAVISVPRALAGQPALLGYLRTGGFPREMALEPSGRILLVTDFSSQQLEAVDAAGLP
jgi:6-phosphogluconolactonase (cycloisomerase 2 family)